MAESPTIDPSVKANANQSAGSALVDNLTALPVAKQVGLVVALGVTLALVISLVMWSQSKPYTLLFGSIDPQDLNEIVQTLDQEMVDYQIDKASGGILVPSEQVHSLRLKMAAAGYPKQAATGYQLLDAEQGFGISQFKETTQYHRALEGELAKSVSSINSVKSARVMLGLPKRSVFVRKRQKPTASVVTKLYPGRTLNDQQVSAIVYLVSSSIPNMEAADVTVVDQNGNLLTGNDQAGSMLNMSMKQLDYTRQVELTLSNRIIDLLAPIVGGPEKVRAQVTAELDFTQQEQTRENYQPDPDAIRSEQEIREINRENGPTGVPGALTNQPPRAGIAPEEGFTKNGANGGVNSSSEKTTKNYELDRTISHIKNSVGTISRLSVAVVLDDKLTQNEAGEFSRTPLTDDELQRYQQLVRDTVGLDSLRGDTLSVVNASFLSVPEEEIAATPIWQEPWFWDLVKQVLAGLAVLIIILFVIRPMLRDLSKRHEIATEYPDEVAEEVDDIENTDEISKALEQMNEDVEQAAEEVEAESAEEQQLIEKVREIADRDPKLAAHVIRQWLSSEGAS